MWMLLVSRFEFSLFLSSTEKYSFNLLQNHHQFSNCIKYVWFLISWMWLILVKILSANYMWLFNIMSNDLVQDEEIL